VTSSFSLIVVLDGKVHMLDLAAKLDSTAEYLCKLDWGEIEFPPPFGRDALPEVIKYYISSNYLAPLH